MIYEKGITVKVFDFKLRADREWYLPHQPVLNPNKPSKVRLVLNGASKCHSDSLNKSLWLARISFITSFLYFYESVSIKTPFQPTLKGCFYRLESGKNINLLFTFCGRRPNIKCGNSPIHASQFQCSCRADLCGFWFAENCIGSSSWVPQSCFSCCPAVFDTGMTPWN